jgi:hypothetical protein
MTLTTIKHGRHRYKKYKITQKFNKTFKIRERTNIAAKLYGNDTYLIPLLWKLFMISSVYTKTEEQNGAN